MADRIQARAIRRCGELLKQIEPKHTGRPSKNGAGSGPNLTRKEAGKRGGLTGRQQKTALRVANVPTDEFEAEVESDEPPTVTKLAERGTKKKKPTASLPTAVGFPAACGGATMSSSGTC